MNEKNFEDKKGNCEVCNTEYIKEVYDFSGSNPNHWQYVHQTCPNCFYNPQIKEDVSGLIDVGISARIEKGKIKYNTFELSNLVRGEIIKHIKSLENKTERRWHELLCFSGSIEEVFNKNIKGSFSNKGTLKINTCELSDLVNNEVISLWQKYAINNDNYLGQKIDSGYLK
ncbi:MAG: hypothetical protein ACP5OG_03850 [Candidatus Nanoarchaeia archaeon]